MQGEKIVDTTFYRAIMKYYPNGKLFIEAAKNNWTLCIPQSWSINFEVKKSDIEKHILTKRNVGDDFYTKVGTRIKIANNNIEILSSSGKIVKKIPIIEFSEYYLKDNALIFQNNQITCIYISCPFEGGIEAPPSIEDTPRCDFDKYMAILFSFPENEQIFYQMDEMIKSIKSCAKKRDNFLDLFQPPLSQQIKAHCEYFVDRFLSTFRLKNIAVSEKFHIYISQAVESYVNNHIHDYIYPQLVHLIDKKLKKYTENIELIKKNNGEYLEIDRKWRGDYSDVINLISTIRRCRTPFEILQLFMRTFDKISDCMKQIIYSKNIDPDSVPSLDDYIQILVYVLSISFPATKHILVDLLYIKMFYFQSLECCKIGQRYYHFELCAKYVKKYHKIHKESLQTPKLGKSINPENKGLIDLSMNAQLSKSYDPTYNLKNRNTLYKSKLSIISYNENVPVTANDDLLKEHQSIEMRTSGSLSFSMKDDYGMSNLRITRALSNQYYESGTKSPKK